MATAGDQINRALRLLGVLAEGETPSAETSQDALMALNQMIDSWNTERLSVFSTQDQEFLWPPGVPYMTRSLGPSGDFIGNRPVQVDDSTYFLDPQTNVSFGIKIINQQQYDGIAVKTVTSTYPQVMWINMEFPNISMTIYVVQCSKTRYCSFFFIDFCNRERHCNMIFTIKPLYFLNVHSMLNNSKVYTKGKKI